MTDFLPLDIAGPLVVSPKRHGDARGWFSETWREDVFAAAAGPARFVQDNQSFSARRGTLRGLHFQKPPMAQGKLVRVVRGRILDVAVDIRIGSPTFGRHVAVELSAADGRQLWIPEGFLHGFCTLEDDSDVIYKVTNTYSPAHDAGVIWSDPDLAIAWPFPPEELILSDKDRRLPRLDEGGSPFRFEDRKKET